MKRILLILTAIALVACVGGAQEILYQDQATLQWDPITADANGDPLLTGDVVTYEVYYYDANSPPTDVQDTAQLTYAGNTTLTELVVTWSVRREWVVGVRGYITDGGGNSGDPSLIAWSNVLEDVDVATMGGPFIYVPLAPTLSPAAPDNLRDSGT